MDLHQDTHNRYNPLLDQWVKISPHRTKRPWNGQTEEPVKNELPSYDPHCYLCPGNSRAGGKQNPAYTGTYVFDNDYAALLKTTDSDSQAFGPNGLLRAQGEKGICKVVCFSPRHDLTLALMEVPQIAEVVDIWTDEYRTLGSLDYIDHVQIFENRGAMMGCSNPHPHSQIWAEEHIPDIPAKEMETQQRYKSAHGSSLLLDYARYEKETGERIFASNDSFIAVIPFWAVWPYEAMILPIARSIGSLDELDGSERIALADIMHQVGIRYDNLFSTSFPYSMGMHQRPTDGQKHESFQFHIHYFPPLLRSATVRKFMVGYEMLAMPQRDITAEQAAATLRSLSAIHYCKHL